MLVKIKFKIISASTPDTEFWVPDSLFTSLASDGLVYPEANVVTPEPRLWGDLYENQYSEGWGIYHVYKTDAEPLLRFEYGIVYFKLYQ